MLVMNYNSIYARVAIRIQAREALSLPLAFARWGKEHMFQVPVMATWTARRWLGAFLLEMTGVPWLVTMTSLDLAEMPRHDPQKPLEPHERSTDDPPLPMPLWMEELTRDDVSGAVIVRFIDEVLHAKHATDKPDFLPLAG